MISGLGRSPGGGHDNPLQYCCLENPHGQRSLASCNEVLEAGFVIDEDGPEDIMDVFGDMDDADTYED